MLKGRSRHGAGFFFPSLDLKPACADAVTVLEKASIDYFPLSGNFQCVPTALEKFVF